MLLSFETWFEAKHESEKTRQLNGKQSIVLLFSATEHENAVHSFYTLEQPNLKYQFSTLFILFIFIKPEIQKSKYSVSKLKAKKIPMDLISLISILRIT